VFGQLGRKRPIRSRGDRPWRWPDAGTLRSEALLRPDHVPLVRAVLDVAADALPVRLIRVVALQEHLESEAEGRVTDRLLADDVDAPIDVLARHGGLELLDSHEILFVERPQAIDRDLEVPNQLLCLGLLHRAPVSGYSRGAAAHPEPDSAASVAPLERDRST
jgi:hypothetical protein